MKKTSWPFYLCLCGLLLFACQDEQEPPIIPPENTDLYEGTHNVVTLHDETEDFHYSDFICALSTENGTVISRKGEHLRLHGKSILTFDTGLKAGTYRLLYLKSPVVESAEADTTWIEYGLGCRIAISEEVDTVKVLDAYSKAMQLSGKGTEKEPFIVSSSDHLKRIRKVANDQIKNNLLLENTHFLQTVDIDMYSASEDADFDFGWLAIGSQPTNPFRGIYDGGGHTIRNLWAKRSQSSGVALFGFAATAVFKNIRLENPRMEGHYAVGSLLGASVSAGNKREKTILLNCSTNNGYISSKSSIPEVDEIKGSVGIGGLMGTVDMHGMCLIDSCANNNTEVFGSYGIGGLLGMGSLYSQICIEQSSNSGSVTSEYTGAGGIIGTADSLFVMSCSNTAAVTGGTSYIPSDKNNGGFGTGGIAGGSGISYIYTCTNEGDITGNIGVGGIIGSTRVGLGDGSDEILLNNTMTKSCANTGTVKGQTSVGGICGEAQFGGYAVYNTGTVVATAEDSHVGGIVGNTSISVVHNALNSGKVSASNTHCAGGIIGKTTWGAIFACQNIGNIDVKADYAGGIIGLAGNYTMINYCYNVGLLSNAGNGSTGGIIGEIGDPRKWSTTDIISCVIGSVECVMAFVGPVLATTGQAIEKQIEVAGKEVSSALLKSSKCVHFLHMAEVLADAFLILSDDVMLGLGVGDMLTEEEMEMLDSSLKMKTAEIDSNVRAKMASLRSGYSLAAGLLAPELNSDITATYNQYTDKLLTFYEASDENMDLINYNINNKREERYEQLEERKHIKEIVQKVIAGVCIGVSAVVSIASIPLTAGTSAAVALTVVGTMTTLIGGVNAILEGATDYKNNVVILSQCVNMGKINADNSKYIGGIVGHLEQNGCVLDCVNAGMYTGRSTHTGGLVGHTSSRAEIQRCLSTGQGWKYPINNSSGDMLSYDDLYFYEGVFPDTNQPEESISTRLSIEKLCLPGSYDNWDINHEKSRWQVGGKRGDFPIPYRSEMQDEIENE